jgi:beta-xylosidase
VSAPPAFAGDFPDPFIVNVEGTYFAYATNAGGSNVQVMSSVDLVAWRPLSDALPALPGWAQAGNTWAPSVAATAGSFVLYYTVRVTPPRSRDPGRQAISVATSPQPEGPFTDVSDGPLIFQLDQGGSIDPSPFTDSDGSRYLVWKADANALNRPSTLWGQPLSEDGLVLTGSATKLLDFDAPWEDPLIEAPSLVQTDGRYYLFYSANWWASGNYAVGYAVGGAPLGPYDKITTSGPWFASDADVAGPGGQEFFVDHGGALRIAYHGWQPGQVGYPAGVRTLRLGRLAFDGLVPTLIS